MSNSLNSQRRKDQRKPKPRQRRSKKCHRLSSCQPKHQKPGQLGNKTSSSYRISAHFIDHLVKEQTRNHKQRPKKRQRKGRPRPSLVRKIERNKGSDHPKSNAPQRQPHAIRRYPLENAIKRLLLPMHNRHRRPAPRHHQRPKSQQHHHHPNHPETSNLLEKDPQRRPHRQRPIRADPIPADHKRSMFRPDSQNPHIVAPVEVMLSLAPINSREATSRLKLTHGHRIVNAAASINTPLTPAAVNPRNTVRLAPR